MLDESFLKKLETLKILARKGVRGVDAGVHRSFRPGSSLEFMDFRTYQPGDDLRYVDWKAYGRTNRLFVKLFHNETDQALHILLDTSRSMDSGTPDKALFGKKLAAALAYLGLISQDRVGITPFSASLEESYIPARGKRVYPSLVDFLSGLAWDGETRLNPCLEAFARSGHPRGAVVVVSDLLDPGGCETGLRALCLAGYRPCLIQVLSPAELSPEIDGFVRLTDAETGRQHSLRIDPAMARRYRRQMRRFLDGIRVVCRRTGTDYHLADTAGPFEEFFLEFLATVRRTGR